MFFPRWLPAESEQMRYVMLHFFQYSLEIIKCSELVIWLLFLVYSQQFGQALSFIELNGTEFVSVFFFLLRLICVVHQ